MTTSDPGAMAPESEDHESGLGHSESPRARFIRRFRRQQMAKAALAFVVLLIVAAVFAPLIAPHDPIDQNLRNSFGDPGWDHWLGADRLGRDTLSRLIFGARFSLMAAVQAVAVAAILGVPIGILAGFMRGWVDAIASTIADAILSIPAIVLALAIIGMPQAQPHQTP